MAISSMWIRNVNHTLQRQQVERAAVNAFFSMAYGLRLR
jgi:hypothetical protein